MRVGVYVFGGALAGAAIIVALFGVRGMKSDKPPIQVFPDMKLQPKYRPQGENDYFTDRRDMRVPPPGTVAFGGRNYGGDAGHPEPNLDFLQDDDVYYRGVIKPDAKLSSSAGAASSIAQLIGSENLSGLTGFAGSQEFWKSDAKLYVHRIPAKIDPFKPEADKQERWARLTPATLDRGREVFNYTCAICHGLTGNGKGVTKNYGMNPANLHDPAIVPQPDGKIFDTITNGRGTMKGYGHMVRPADRWAVLAYVRALQRSQRGSASDIPPEFRRELGIE